MTHEELLKRIDTARHTRIGELIIRTDALRAVVELHKPDDSFCCECSHDTEVLEYYPCPTIQAIEKELL